MGMSCSIPVFPAISERIRCTENTDQCDRCCFFSTRTGGKARWQFTHNALQRNRIFAHGLLDTSRLTQFYFVRYLITLKK